jgi:DNA-binding CsgD family transcriptional regulator
MSPTLASGMLEAVGLTEQQERAYRYLLAHPGASAREVAEGCGLAGEAAASALSTLADARMVVRTDAQPPTFVPSPPDVALDLLILQRKQEAEQARAALGELMDEFSQGARKQRFPYEIEFVPDPQDVLARSLQLHHSARTQLRRLDAPPYLQHADKLTIEQTDAHRKVRHRAVCDVRGLEIPARLADLESCVAAGEEARILPDLDYKLMLVDDDVAFVPVIEGGRFASALVVRSADVVRGLIKLFELTWNAALPFASARETPGDAPAGFTPSDRRLLTLLALGIKDEAIAREMQVGVRTVERRIRNVMTLLGVRTRFQAGIEAERRGLL